MATSDILGLFVSPEQYQAQQLAQQQANEQQRAFNFAQLSPRDQAVYGTFLGAQQLGRGFSGLLGVQDPQLQRIRQRDQLMQSINPADPASLMAGIKAATNAGDQELALTLTDFMNKQGSEMALAQQRKAQAERERTQALPAGIQEAARVAEIERTLSKLDKVNDATEIKALTEEKARLQKSAKTAGITDDEKKAAAYANNISADPESEEWKDAFGNALNRLIFGKEGAEKTTDAIVNATALADATGKPKTSVEWKNEFNTQLKRLTTKEIADKYSPEAQKLIDAGYIPGSPSFISKMDEIISKDLSAKQDKGVSFGTDREAIAQELFGKRFSDLTQEQQATVNKRKEEEEQKKTPKTEIKNVLPGQGKDGLTGIGKFRNEVGESIKPFRSTVNAADAALQNIDDSIKSNNFTSFNAARVQLAKALGDSTLSRRDIEQAGGDPSLLGGFFDATSTLFTGTPTVDTQRKIKSTLQAIRKVARKKAQDELAVQRQLGIRAGYTNDDINMAFNFPEIMGGGDGAAKPENKKTVPFNALPKK